MPTTQSNIAKPGSKSVYGLGKESTFGVAVAPTAYIEPINPVFTPDVVPVKRSGIRNTIGQTTPGVGRVDLKGSFELETIPDVIGIPLGLAMGLDTVTLNSPSTGANTHVITLATPRNTCTFSADYLEVTGGGGTIHQFVGCKVSSLDITCKPSSFLSMKFGVVGVKDTTTTGTLASGATYTLLQPYLFEHITSATLDGSAIPLDSISISAKPDVKPRWYGGSGRYPGAMDEAEYAVTGSFSAAYTNETIYNALASPNNHALVITFTHPATAGSSTSNYSLTLTMNNITVESVPVDPKRNDVTMYNNIKFSAYESAQGLQDDLKITLVDAVTTAYTS